MPGGRYRHDLMVKPSILVPRHAAALGAGLVGGADRSTDAEHPHRLQAEAQLLASLGGGDVVPAEVAGALEHYAEYFDDPGFKPLPH